MVKLNKQGFTLIELLAVIVIIGILMLVAIPAMNRYMENSKKTTFINNAKMYVNAARNAFNTDDVLCVPGSDFPTAQAANYTISPQSLQTGKFYIPITTLEFWKNANYPYQRGYPYQNLEKLVDSVQKSPWGNDFSGMIEIQKEEVDNKTTTTYRIAIMDNGHYVRNAARPYPIDINNLSKDDVKTSNVGDVKWWVNLDIHVPDKTASGVYMCKIND